MWLTCLSKKGIFFISMKMTVPKSKVLSVSKGLMALADFKTGSPDINNSQSVIVNVSPGSALDHKIQQETKTRKAVVNGEELSDVVIVPNNKDVKVQYEENPYENISTRDLTTIGDVQSDIQQLQNLVKEKENIAKALSIMLNLVENNPLVVNKIIIAPENILAELIKLLTSADQVKISYILDNDVGCSCGSVKYIAVDKIYIVKNEDTQILKYSYPDVIQILDDHKISYKLVANEN